MPQNLLGEIENLQVKITSISGDFCIVEFDLQHDRMTVNEK